MVILSERSHDDVFINGKIWNEKIVDLVTLFGCNCDQIINDVMVRVVLLSR